MTQKGGQKQNHEMILKQASGNWWQRWNKKGPLFVRKAKLGCSLSTPHPAWAPWLQRSSPTGPLPFPIYILPTPEPQLRIRLPTRSP